MARDDPYGAFNFLVDLGTGDGTTVSGGFSDVTGLSSEIEYAEYRNGNEKENHARLIPTLHRTGEVILRRGVIGDLGLFEWVKQTREGSVQPRNVTITLLDESRNPVLACRLRSALPKRWVGPALAAKAGGAVAMEELVLVAEQIDVESP
jgi:phage tail-like protein